MARQDLTIAVTAEDRASNVFAKIGRALQGLDDSSKFSLGKLGKAAEGRGDLADTLQDAGGKGIGGMVGKLGAAAAIAEFAGRAMQSVGQGASDLVKRVDEAKASGLEMAGEFGRSIPVVGTVAKGFDKVGAGARDVVASVVEMTGASKGWVEWLESGERALRRQTEEAKKQTEEITRRRGALSAVAAEADKARNRESVEGQHSEAGRIRASAAIELSASLDNIQKQRSKLVAGGASVNDAKKDLDDQERIARARAGRAEIAAQVVEEVEREAAVKRELEATERLRQEQRTRDDLRREAYERAKRIVEDGEKSIGDLRADIARKELESQGRDGEARANEIDARAVEQADAERRATKDALQTPGMEDWQKEQIIRQSRERLKLIEQLAEQDRAELARTASAELDRLRLEQNDVRVDVARVPSAGTAQGPILGDAIIDAARSRIKPQESNEAKEAKLQRERQIKLLESLVAQLKPVAI